MKKDDHTPHAAASPRRGYHRRMRVENAHVGLSSGCFFGKKTFSLRKLFWRRAWRKQSSPHATHNTHAMAALASVACPSAPAVGGPRQRRRGGVRTHRCAASPFGGADVSSSSSKTSSSPFGGSATTTSGGSPFGGGGGAANPFAAAAGERDRDAPPPGDFIAFLYDDNYYDSKWRAAPAISADSSLHLPRGTNKIFKRSVSTLLTPLQIHLYKMGTL